MKTNKLLAVVVALQGLVLIGQWTGGPHLASAQAQVPDPANRQMQMIDELKGLNSKMDQIVSILQDGKLQVKVSNPDDNKGGSGKSGK